MGRSFDLRKMIDILKVLDPFDKTNRNPNPEGRSHLQVIEINMIEYMYVGVEV